MYYSLNPNCGFERNRIPPIDSRRRRSSYKRGSHLLHINVNSNPKLDQKEKGDKELLEQHK